MGQAIAFQANDGEVLEFTVPRQCNRWLILKALEKINRGGDEAAVLFGLTRKETEVVALVRAALEEHGAVAA